MTTSTEMRILDKLNEIKIELDYIKKNIPNTDMFLTTEEKELLEQSYKNEKEGKLVSSKNLRKQLGI